MPEIASFINMGRRARRLQAAFRRIRIPNALIADKPSGPKASGSKQGGSKQSGSKQGGSKQSSFL